MICSKGQLVRLAPAALDGSPTGAGQTARVTSLVYLEQPEGERGVQLDRELLGNRWWNENNLEEAS